MESQKLVTPLGVFGPRGENPFTLTREQLIPLVDRLDSSTRKQVANYLRQGTTILPVMGYTEDVIGGTFGVSGGIAIVSDGIYYWRRDAAEYVEHYGIGLPEEQIAHMSRSSWEATSLSAQKVAEIDKFLAGNLRFQ